jgi:transposase-like protein
MASKAQREVLRRQGWTVAAIAREWGMHPSTVDKWVREGR